MLNGGAGAASSEQERGEKMERRMQMINAAKDLLEEKFGKF